MERPHRSPANIPAHAAAPMPRWALPVLVLAFLLPGLFARDLWPQDATGFGRMWSMAHGGFIDWLLPDIAGAPALDGGPLPYWFGALLVRIAGPLLGDTGAAFLANLAWYPIAVLAIWQAIYRLARRDEAQPVAAAFGGEASRDSYARLIADIGALLTIGTLGTIWRIHQVQPDGAALALTAGALFAATAVEWQRDAAAVAGGLCAGALALTLGPVPGGALLIASAVAHWRAASTAGGTPLEGARAVLLLVVAGLALAAAWPLAALAFFPREAGLYFSAWLAHVPLGLPDGDALAWLLRTGAWFTWPLWPLAAWGVYAWRGSLHSSHLARPLVLLAGLAVALVLTVPTDERSFIPVVAPLVVLAAFGATTLRRALDNAIDWLAMTLFSAVLVFLWSYYLALQLGGPRPMAMSIARLAPGFVAHLHGAAVLLALVATAAWVQLMAWRVARRPRVLWRGPLLAAAGVTVVWGGANLLFLPAVDYVLSYRTLAQEVAHELQARGLGGGCVQAHRVPLAERALLAYYGQIRFDREGSAETCRLALHREMRRSPIDNDPPPGVRGMWEPAWEGHRRVKPDERWRIWIRAQ